MFPYVPETSGCVSYKVLLRGFVSDVPGLFIAEPTGSPSLGLGPCCENKVWKVQHSLRFASGVLYKKLGPSASQKLLDRICNSLDVIAAMVKLFDSNLAVFRRSGKHIHRSTKNDTEKLVNELVTNKAFTYTPGRKYTSYAKMKPSILCGFNLQKMFTWINEHKKHMILYRRAR